jgi:allantoicase
MSDFQDLTDLASERVGGSVLYANDEFFAAKENLIRSAPPVFLPHEYTDRGKWMDGWESRRRRTPGHDFCIVRLGLPGVLRGLVVDTSNFIGNYPEHCSLEACVAAPGADLNDLLGPSTRWVEVLPRSLLQGNAQNLFAIDDPRRFTHLRFHIYPDGGVARLRVHGEVIPDWKRAGAFDGSIDLAAVEHGGQVLMCSDMFFGNRHNLIMPGRALNMGDGWETKRRRGPGYDWAIVKLGAPGAIRRIEVDTNHFKGNYPDTCMIEGCLAEGAAEADLIRPDWAWREILPRTKLEPHTRHFFVDEIKDAGEITHARLNIYPDGGVSRLRLFGTLDREGRATLGLKRLNTLIGDDAEAELRACCASEEWVRRMIERRPFRTVSELYEAADEIWRALRPEEWLEAFRAHPRIGDREAARPEGGAFRKWSSEEQSGVRGAGTDTLSALAEANRQYEARFGFVFLICATGKSAEEMLASAKERLQNAPAAELGVAAEQQRQITRIRLGKLLSS